MNTETPVFVTRSFNTLRAIVGGMLMAIAIFAGLVAFVQTQVGACAPGLEFLVFIGIAVLVIDIGLQFVLLPVFDSAVRRRIDPRTTVLKPWRDGFYGRTIFGCMLIKGAAFFCIVCSLIDGQPTGIIAGVAGAVAIFVLHWPSEARVQAYVERQREMALNERG